MIDSKPRKGWSMDRFSWSPAWLRRLSWEAVTALMLLLIAASIIGQIWYLHDQDVKQAAATKRVDDAREVDRLQAEADATAQRQCLADTIRDFAEVLQARGLPADIERQATRNLILGFIGGDVTTEQQGQVIAQAYQDAIASADQLRADHPIPDYPTGLCAAPAPPPKEAK